MVSIPYLRSVYGGKKVFLTGHTGFKGSWLLQILSVLGARVVGYALPPEQKTDLFNQIEGETICDQSILHDIQDAAKVKEVILETKPDFIFHLAAQPLVLPSYESPLYTFSVNGQGTGHVLDALRFLKEPCIAIFITTDKVYENDDHQEAFRENDKLGGYDPYSASKAVAEIIIASYRASFFNPKHYAEHLKSIASVRAGNVIGGGDWASNRIIPDLIRAVNQNQELQIRNPKATRPWQHVLEPLSAYLLLGAQLSKYPERFCKAYNVGPDPKDVLPVETLVQIALNAMHKSNFPVKTVSASMHEAATLQLNSELIREDIGWTPRYDARIAIQETMNWYINPDPADIKCLQQINSYFEHGIEHADEY